MAFEGIGNMLTNFGQYTQKNPEKFAIAMDMLGQGFAPNNPFAGVGTAMGKSSLANKASQQQTSMLASLLAGDAPTAPAAGTTPAQPTATPAATPQEGSALNIPMTPANQVGVTSVTQQAQPDGSIVMTPKITTQVPAASQNNTMNLSDFLTFSNALSANPVDLTGLTPAEIGAIMGQTTKIAELGRLRLKDLMAGQEAAATAQREDKRLKIYTDVQEATIAAKEAETKIRQAELELKKAKSPAEIELLRSQIMENTYQSLNAAAQAAKTDAETSQINDRIAATNTIQAKGLDNVDYATIIKAFGPTAAASMRNTTVTQERLAEGARLIAEADRNKAYADAVANLAKSSDEPQFAIGDMSRANWNSPDTATTAYYYDSNWSDSIEMMNLPKVNGRQVTMEEVRFTAEQSGDSIENILKQLREYKEK